MSLRDRREERRDERRGGGSTYRMREKLVSIGDDYWIEDEQGRRAFKVNGKAMRIRDTMVFEDAGGVIDELGGLLDQAGDLLP